MPLPHVNDRFDNWPPASSKSPCGQARPGHPGLHTIGRETLDRNPTIGQHCQKYTAKTMT